MSDNRPRVCVVGSVNIDLTFRTARLPAPGETLTAHGFHIGFGGKGANQAVMAARLGARVDLVARLGRDPFAEPALANLHAQGIETAHVLVAEGHTSGAAAILVDDDACNCILVASGANNALTPHDVKAAAAVIAGAEVLLCQCEVPIETSLEAFRVGKAAGVLTILNPAPAQPLPDELLKHTDLCVPNEVEAGQLTGRTVTTPDEAAAAARDLLQRGPETVIVTLGAGGSLLAGAEGIKVIPAPAVRAVDPSGAGDAFIGSLAVFLARGRPLPEAVRAANAVAALSVTRAGTQTSFPSRAEAEALLADLPAL